MFNDKSLYCSSIYSFLTFFITFIFLLLPIPAQTECRKASPSISLREAELDADEMLAVWQVNPFFKKNGVLKRKGSLNLTPIDPNTGIFLIDQTISFPDANPIRINVTNNGPEWGYSQRGSEAYFSAFTPDLKNTQIGRISKNFNGEWQLSFVPNSEGLARPEPSKTKTDLVPKIYYTHATLVNPSKIEFGLFSWREDINNFNEIFMKDDDRTGRWTPDGNLFHHNLIARTPRRISQLSLYDIKTFQDIPLTNDESNYFAVGSWSAPELGGSTVLLSTVTPPNGNETYLITWRQASDGNWVPWAKVHSFDPNFPHLDSPEPFVYQGRSYLLLTSRSALSVNLSTDSIIWITTVDPSLSEDQSIKKVISQEFASGKISIKADPEVLVTPNNGVWIYYNDKGYSDIERSGMGLLVCGAGL